MAGRSGLLSRVEIPGELVSWQNPRLRLVNGAIWVEDLSSTRGAPVQGQPVTPLQPVRIGVGSVVQIGDLSYRIRLE